MNEQTIRWGIIGTGRIARAFAEGLKFTNNGGRLMYLGGNGFYWKIGASRAPSSKLEDNSDGANDDALLSCQLLEIRRCEGHLVACNRIYYCTVSTRCTPPPSPHYLTLSSPR